MMARKQREGRGCALDVHAGFSSVQGLRAKNEDYLTVCDDVGFFALSDGIGGAGFGEVMSRVACNAAYDAYLANGDIAQAFISGNNAAYQVKRWLKSDGSGATLLLAAVSESTLHLAGAGDTVAYLLRNESLSRLISPDRKPGSRNVLTSAAGIGQNIEPAQISLRMRSGDRILLATDGAWDVLGNEELQRLLCASASAPFVANMIANAGAEAGKDNASVVVLDACVAGEESGREV